MIEYLIAISVIVTLLLVGMISIVLMGISLSLWDVADDFLSRLFIGLQGFLTLVLLGLIGVAIYGCLHLV